jgi:hypothetical protein
MKPAELESTPDFAHYTSVMRRVLAVPKSELDELVERSKKTGMSGFLLVRAALHRPV